MTKKILLGMGLILFLLCVLASVVLYTDVMLADIKPKGAKASIAAKAWFQKALKAHGTLQRWQSLREARVEMTAIFPKAIMRKALGPFRSNAPKLSWTYTPSKGWPVTIQETQAGAKAATYAHQGKETYREIGQQKENEPWRFRFFVRSIRHLLDFTFAMRSADIVMDAGDAAWNTQKYARIFMTWKHADANRHIDQYILWINKRTHLVERFDCTGRAVMPLVPTPFIVARVEMTGYKRAKGGLQMPSKIMVYRGNTNSLVHGYILHKTSFR